MSTDLEEIVQSLEKYFSALKIDFFIIGATARDIISAEVGLQLSPRKTSDVDFGILVDSWDTLKKMRELFKVDSRIKLSSDKNNKVRHYFNGTPFDLVPFGGVEKDGKISWPPFYETIMNVVGYKEALQTSREITVGETVVKVVTPEMLVALKLVSWGENPAREKDAQDINYIISNYEIIDPDAYECVLDNHEELLKTLDYETDLASIALMGVRISKFTAQEHKKVIFQILEDVERKEKLARNMVSTSGYDDGKVETCIKKLDALRLGLEI